MTTGIVGAYKARGVETGAIYSIIESEEFVETISGFSTEWVASGYRSFEVGNHENKHVHPVYDPELTIIRFVVTDTVTDATENAFILAPAAQELT